MAYDEITAQTIRALAQIDVALGLPDDGCNSTAQTLSHIADMQDLIVAMKEVTSGLAEYCHHHGIKPLMGDKPELEILHGKALRALKMLDEMYENEEGN